MLSAEFRNGNATGDFNALTEKTIVTLAGLEKACFQTIQLGRYPH